MSQDKDQLSRRGFLQNTAASAAVSRVGDSAPQHSAPFSPNTKPRKLSDHLYVLEDTCNVYLLKDGTSGILIDFGSGDILNHLTGLGISSIDWILHTHHHRDQAQGDHLAAARNIPIAVPEHEQEYFQNAENFWRNRRVFDLYYVRNDFFSLTRNIPVAALLHDYEVFRWKQHEILIQPTPGHTPGSVTLIASIDNRRVAFSGDLMHSPGHVQTLYDMQYYYGEHEGVDLSAYSLSQLIALDPQLLCPSHGSEIVDPIPGMQESIRNLGDWYRFWHPGGGFTLDNKPRQLTPHVIAHFQTMSCFYAIISDSGKALFLDYGGPSWNSFYAFKDAIGPYGHFRFIEHSIENLRRRHGLKSIDVAIPSHMHDDHLNGFPYLVRRHGTKIWCFENFVDILEHPRGHNLGCTFGEPIQVDRVIRDKETFRWEEFEFTAVHSPGHTNFQMALFTTIDGLRIAFTGDAFFHDADRPFQIRHNLIYRNRVKIGDYLKSVQNLLDFEPHVIAPGHGEPFMLDLDMLSDFKAKLEKQDALCRALVADPDTDIGLDPSWIEIYPYQSIVLPGRTYKFELRARNHRQKTIDIEAALVLPPTWRSEPSKVTFSVGPRGVSAASVAVTAPAGFHSPISRLAIAADVITDGKYLGQIAEAVVDVVAPESPVQRSEPTYK